MAETAPPLRRKRFQFSLRTLMIAVFAYCGLWLLTQKWGGAMLTREFAERYKIDSPQIDANGLLVLSHNPVTYDSSFRTIFRGRVISPAPFILLWRWEEHADLDYFSRVEESDGSYFWFLGYHFPIHKDLPPYPPPLHW